MGMQALPRTLGLIFAIFFLHLNWYLVVKRQGGCLGRHGYLAWAVYLALEPLLLWQVFGQYYGGALKLLLYVPNFFMIAACLLLFRAPPEEVGTATWAVNNFKTTAKAVAYTCRDICPWLCPPEPVQPQR